jgi:hypothetical protein
MAHLTCRTVYWEEQGGGATAEMVFVRSIGIGMGTHLGKAQLEEEE